MNPFYNQQWRPAPPAVCPVCSHAHFPLCPPVAPIYPPSQPPPIPSSWRNAPPVPDSYHYHNPNPYHYRPPPHQDFVPPLPSVSNVLVPEPARSVKRPRVEHTDYLDEDPRLKLIHDHEAPIPRMGQTAWSPMGPGHRGYGSDLNNGVLRAFPPNNFSHRGRNNSYGCQWYPIPPPRGLADGVFPGKPPQHPALPLSLPPPPPQEINSPRKASVAFLPDSGALKKHGSQISQDMRTVIDASRLFKQPYRASRCDRLVIILRGLPGSGKSYMAKMMRNLEVENGGEAPRIHSMDDYFMTEVEKVDDCETSKSATLRSKKPAVKKVLEYCYEPEMEEAYRESMLKAFKKTLEDGVFRFVIVDDRNLRVADFAQFWAAAKVFRYEVYISEAAYKDPVGCTARNVHGFTLDDIKRMALQWEETPTFYLQLDVKALFGGDDLKSSGIQEVDMDAGEGDYEEVPPEQPQDKIDYKVSSVATENIEIRELGKSKWLDNGMEDHNENSENIKCNFSALSDLSKAYQKSKKSVRWSDQASFGGFSLGAVLKKTSSLVIGSGPGYNLKSNPLSADETGTSNNRSRNDQFHERMRAERASFKAVFSRSKQRIQGLSPDDN